jgi:LmbE family N-acetylglucosaminyl deacetylase
MNNHDAPKKNINLIYRLRGLGMAGAILHIGAHPDDEDVGLMAYVARKLGNRIVYWSATRGEGGQNRLGPDTQEALGVYRTWESLAVRSVDGGEALFGPFYDFGYSKSGAETLVKWGGEETVIKEIVRAIRLVQPQIVIGRWTGNPSTDGHGHHQAIGSVTLAAFEAAGDASQFPELQAQGLVAWQPDKLFYSTGGDWQPGEEGGNFGIIRPEFERDGYVRINSGEFDPIANRTYQEQGWIGFNHHKTQAMGFIPEKEPFYYYYLLAFSDQFSEISDQVSEDATLSDDRGSFYSGLDGSLTGLADYPSDGAAGLREKLAAIKGKANAALVQYRADEVVRAGMLLLEGVALLRALRVGETELALLIYLERKLEDFEETAVSCFGLDLECLANYAHVTPGQQFRVAARLWNPRHVAIGEPTFTLQLPQGWQVQPVEQEDNVAVYDVTASTWADLACPYWLRSPRAGHRYHWPEGEPAGRPFAPPLVELECKVTLGTHKMCVRSPAIMREGFAGGFRELPVIVVPPISLQPKIRQEFLQVRESEQQLGLTAVAYSNMEQQGIEGTLRLEAPPEWQVEPPEIQLRLGSIGDSQTVKFRVTIPKNRVAGVYALRYVVQCDGREYDVVLKPVRMSAPGLPRLPDAATCIKEQFITNSAVNHVHLIETKFVPGLKYGYIKGATEEILTALAHFNLDFHIISDAEMGYIDLDQFDAIVVGPNAYLMRDELRKNAPRFPKFVAQGGTLIVQYQGYGYQKEEFVPYPFTFSQPHDRVTDEDATVTILEPDHFLFHQPNKISAADFENWVHDRGMYFFGQWDKRYTPFLASNDRDEVPKKGGLLLTSYGRGTFIYAAYSFFRQLPAGVPGAFRLFANILAVPAALILARAQFLKNVSLFAFMDEDQRQTVAKILSERWQKDGEYLCHQGDEGDEMYIIVKGEVAIIKEVARKASQIIYRAKAGEAIGEMQVLSKSSRAAAMQAQGDIHLLVIEGAHFRALMHQHPDMSDRVIQMLVNKLAAAGQT